MKRLEGKVAIITGAANGQGVAEAKLFASEGAKVIVTDIDEVGVKKTAIEISNLGGSAFPLQHDVSLEEDWKIVVKTSIEQFGRVDILINNAGIPSRKNVEEETVEEWDKVQAVNSRSVFLGMKYTVPEIRKVGGGSIINVSSVYGIIGVKGYAAYHASKGAIRVLTKTAAMDFAKDLIRVNSIHPGIIETAMTEDLYADEETLNWLKDVTPWPRLGKPEDVAYGALFLASDESTFITGSELVIDGGWIAH
ncbi:short-chain dehydrogenase [Pueribacillus theae]|uniref:Short-chain dehydrogenase n=1 Tax=Pueribacillus theae TaxID=2171751 RepID=A0A2U1K698_9BACI|nr:glucose 1-dehydrogenase [Pueribacillus theae]PWA13066.1 short-chain dehydrogenase [Pueribacillus theae]